MIKNLKNIAGIYIFSCKTTNKKYIGETLKIKNRIKRHLSSNNLIFHKAIKKYGIENFDLYIEYLPNFNKHDLIILEAELIKKFNSLAPNGYNISPIGGGGSGIKHSENAKRKMSLVKKGIAPSEQCRLASIAHNTGKKHGKRIYPRRGPISQEHREKISEKLKGRESSFKGKKHSEKSKKNMSLAKIGKNTHPNSMNAIAKINDKLRISVVQLDKTTLTPIKIWKSIGEAAKEFFGSKDITSPISNCLKGKAKTAGGFKWKRYEG